MLAIFSDLFKQHKDADWFMKIPLMYNRKMLHHCNNTLRASVRYIHT